jgi:hypothetical protein
MPMISYGLEACAPREREKPLHQTKIAIKEHRNGLGWTGQTFDVFVQERFASGPLLREFQMGAREGFNYRPRYIVPDLGMLVGQTALQVRFGRSLDQRLGCDPVSGASTGQILRGEFHSQYAKDHPSEPK